MSTATPSGPPAVPDPRFINQMRNDVDDVYELLDQTNKSVLTIGSVQRRHGTRLEEIQQSLDLQSGRFERIEDSLRQLQGSQQQMRDEYGQRFERVDGSLQQMQDELRQLRDGQQQILALLSNRPEPGNGASTPE